MTENKPLSVEQHRAASLLGQGRLVKDAAAELGVAPRTVSRWSKREDFRSLVRRQREALVSEVPSAEDVLVQALGAVKENGHPDWQTRVAASKALLSAPVASETARQEARETVLYLAPEPEEEPEQKPKEEEAASC